MIVLGIAAAAGGMGLFLAGGNAPEASDPTPVADAGQRQELKLTLPGQSPREAPAPRRDGASEAKADPPAPAPTRLTPAPDAQTSPDEGRLVAAAVRASVPAAEDGAASAEADAARPANHPGEAVRAAAEQVEKALLAAAERAAGSDLPGEWQAFPVRSGDNLAAVFKRAGLGPRDVHQVINAGGRAGELVRLFPGDTVELRLDEAGTLHGVRYELNETETLLVTRSGEDELTSEVQTRALERRVAEAHGSIDSSLYMAGLDAGLDDRLIMELAGIFGWDVDFALDLRKGDSFVVIYEELYRDGEKLRNGDILAAEFINRGERYRAIRFTEPDGDSDYYAPDGRSMRKAFLRTPVNFARVSSNFNPSRLHPIHGTRRPHLGTDYAAPPGTPIKAAGDGKIIHRGRKGGYGHTVIIQHGTRYTTLYAHMRGYRRGLSVGDRVQQGDVIGYVGSTGLSTGPHLHYEFRVDGTHRNPRTVDLPEATPIAAEYRDEFEAHSRDYIARLDTLSRTLLARIETD